VEILIQRIDHENKETTADMTASHTLMSLTDYTSMVIFSASEFKTTFSLSVASWVWVNMTVSSEFSIHEGVCVYKSKFQTINQDTCKNLNL
jgi:hypothetical protein